jgi:hypothetical protein
MLAEVRADALGGGEGERRQRGGRRDQGSSLALCFYSAGLIFYLKRFRIRGVGGFG